MDTLIVAVRVVLSLGVVLALLWYLQRRLSRGARAHGIANPVTVVGRQPIGQKASVVVVEVDGTRLVLGVTEQAVTVLHEKSVAAVSTSTLETAVAALGSPDASDAFARSLATAEADDAAPAPTPTRPAPLAGSILSPSTWRQTAALLRQGR
ncbi:flagellar protein FliO/FliZ [Cryobacterium flavum]|uniref:Flagellar protein n=1 Tax=Cryobacterium flavum TaxID=1424659 RepID=A0A4R8UWP9_9MICO|nr:MULTISPECIES: flagellar biosynthetic protein FliO [Cryobacterium]TFB73022.1 flagellar biosynthetic protein FliO [Cryobacterium flavum]TFD03525.1 flagellar biosynthetic protein FliO [Cryobacterium sp. TMT1-66-1]TFD12788.1 flagellar biosynthetic protein FliO [Cryobacterium sp. TMT1-2-2]SDN03318.1 flagellar protein FliO/FliZ [Cryobacterium flavum]